MTTLLRFLQILSLGAWLGGIAFIALAVAPGAFATLSSRQEAGAVVGMALTRLHFAGVAAGAIFLACAVLQARGLSALASAASICVILMVVLTLVSQFGVSAKMADLRSEMAAAHGSIDATPQSNPLRAQFGKLHGVSSALELLVLLLGLGAMWLTVRMPPSP